MKLHALALAFLAACAKPLRVEAETAREAIAAPVRQRGRFAGSLKGAIRTERGLGRALHLLSGLSRIGGGR